MLNLIAEIDGELIDKEEIVKESYFQTLSDVSRKKIAAKGTIEDFAISGRGPAKPIVIQGSPVSGLFLVVEGNVKLTMSGTNQSQDKSSSEQDAVSTRQKSSKFILHRFVKMGDFWGEAECCTNPVPRTLTTATPLDDVRLLKISLSDFQELLNDPEVARFFLNHVSQRLCGRLRDIARFRTLSIKEQTAGILLELSSTSRPKKAVLVEDEVLAEQIGCSPEHVNRMLAALEVDELIKRIGHKPRRIIIKDRQGLSDLARIEREVPKNIEPPANSDS